MGLFYAIILIGVLVFVHELGHFLVAKLFDVKVLQFAIGYGPNLVSFYYGETEYCIKAIPLGGYVLMLGNALDEVESLPERDRERALMAKPIWQRALVTLAGPAANILFPIFVYFFISLGNTQATLPVIGEVFADMPAAEAGLQPGDTITAINNKSIRYWTELQDTIAVNSNNPLKLSYDRDGKAEQTTIVPQPSFQTDSLGLSQTTFGLIGVTNTSYGPTIAVPEPDSVAAKAGLQTFDRIISVNGESIERYGQLLSKLRTLKLNHQKEAQLLVLRPEPIEVDWGLVYHNKPTPVSLPLTTTSSDERNDGSLFGIDSAQMYLAEVKTQSPAQHAGFKPFDKVISVDQKPYLNWLRFHNSLTNEVNRQIVQASKNGNNPEEISPSFEVTVLRDGEPITLTLQPQIRKIDKQEAFRVILGFQTMIDYASPQTTAFPFIDRIPYAISNSFSETWKVSKATLTGIWGMLTGRFSLDNLGGPIMIGNLAAKAGDAGLKPFFNMMCLISINLALMNLLPIPMLDGGHLLIYLVEAIQRRPISFRTRQIISYVGIVLILIMIVMAFKNDIERSWDDIVIWLNE